MIPVHLYVCAGQRYSLLRGPGRLFVEGTTARVHWSGPDRGYQVRTDRIPELLARADLEKRWAVTVHELGEVTR